MYAHTQWPQLWIVVKFTSVLHFDGHIILHLRPSLNRSVILNENLKWKKEPTTNEEEEEEIRFVSTITFLSLSLSLFLCACSHCSANEHTHAIARWWRRWRTRSVCWLHLVADGATPKSWQNVASGDITNATHTKNLTALAYLITSGRFYIGIRWWMQHTSKQRSPRKWWLNERVHKWHGVQLHLVDRRQKIACRNNEQKTTIIVLLLAFMCVLHCSSFISNVLSHHIRPRSMLISLVAVFHHSFVR